MHLLITDLPSPFTARYYESSRGRNERYLQFITLCNTLQCSISNLLDVCSAITQLCDGLDYVTTCLQDRNEKKMCNVKSCIVNIPFPPYYVSFADPVDYLPFVNYESFVNRKISISPTGNFPSLCSIRNISVCSFIL